MASRKEAEFSGRLKRRLEGAGGLVFLVHGHAFQAPGWPDLQIYHRIWTGHLELKVDKNPADGPQQVVIRRLKERGTPAFVLREVHPTLLRVEDEVGNVLLLIEGEYNGVEILRALEGLQVK